jgi:type VI secretion system protein ImpE
MTANELYRAGKLDEAVRALSAEVRDNPTDAKRRTFLFELLCFAGDFDRAEKQLEALGRENTQTEMGALLYRAAIAAERKRQEVFTNKDFPAASTAGDDDISGTINGKPFTWVVDADPRIGARLEVFAAGGYLWIPFRHIERIDIQPPKRLRDLLWVPARVLTGPAFKAMELGEVLVPALTVFSWRHPNDNIRLGRETQTEELDGEVIPVGQKILLVDGEEIPILEVRTLEFVTAQSAEAVN